MNLVEATDIAVKFIRKCCGYALPTAGKRGQDGFLVEVLYEVLDNAPRLVIEIPGSGKARLVGSRGQYGSIYGKQAR